MENKLKHINIIENMITNALEVQYMHIQEDNFSEMKEEHTKLYNENRSKINVLEKSLMKILPPDMKKVFLELDSLNNYNTGIESEYMFKKGVIEGLTTFGYLKEASDYIFLNSIKL